MLKLINLAEENVDINGIGMYSLGKYRKSLNENQIKEYKKLEKTEIKEKGEMGEWLKPQVC